MVTDKPTNCPKCSLVKRIGELCKYKDSPGHYCKTCGYHINAKN